MVLFNTIYYHTHTDHTHTHTDHTHTHTDHTHTHTDDTHTHTDDTNTHTDTSFFLFEGMISRESLLASLRLKKKEFWS